MASLLLNTSLGEFSPLIVEGETIVSFYGEISALIKLKLGEEISHFLAEPSLTSKSGVILWRSTLSGDVKSYRDLSGKNKSSIDGALSDYAGKLASFSGSLIGSDVFSEKVAGILISRVVSDLSQVMAGQPGGSEIFLIGGMPVFAGYCLSSAKASPVNIPVVPVSEPSEPDPLDSSHPTPSSSEGAQDEPIFMGFGEPSVTPPPYPYDESLARKNAKRRISPLLIILGSLFCLVLLVSIFLLLLYKGVIFTDPIKTELVIPTEGSDLSFLEGCWRSDNDLVNTSDQPIIYVYCFNQTGGADIYIDEFDDAGVLLGVCTGSAVATFSQGILRIQDDGPSCSYINVQYIPADIECRKGADGRPQCLAELQSSEFESFTTTFTYIGKTR
jgi:hypothetical protein